MKRCGESGRFAFMSAEGISGRPGRFSNGRLLLSPMNRRVKSTQARAIAQNAEGRQVHCLRTYRGRELAGPADRCVMGVPSGIVPLETVIGEGALVIADGEGEMGRVDRMPGRSPDLALGEA